MPKNWTSVGEVARQLESAADFAASVTARETRTIAAGWANDDRIESPLEAIFVVWTLALSRAGYHSSLVAWQRDVEIEGRRYRIDFVLEPGILAAELMRLAGIENPKVAVEVDGHAYHERTLEQVTSRNERDRALQRAGWKVFHYSWSELTTKPIRCVMDAFEYYSSEVIRAVLEKSQRG